MKVKTEQLALQLETPFKLSYGATNTRHNLLIHIDDGQHIGTGEAAIVPYYDVTPEGIQSYIASLEALFASATQPLTLIEHLNTSSDKLSDALSSDDTSFARAALDIALHDLWGKHQGQPLYRLWGLNPESCPINSFTVSMADDEMGYREKLRAAHHYPLIKLKLGSGSVEQDLQLVKIARSELNSQLCIDANGGWSSADGQMILPHLMDMDIVFIEQPVAKDDFAGWRVLRDIKQRPPLIADESVQGIESVAKLAGLVDGINIKLMKCGGLRAAQQMITLAKSHDMQVMLGCMIESSVAITAMAHLAPLADYADLDGNLLITNDPYVGVQVDNGHLRLPDAPGLGIQKRL